MKRLLTLLLMVLFLVGCAPVAYVEGVEWDTSYPEVLPIYDDAIVYHMEQDKDTYIIKAGIDDSYHDIVDFYQDYFEEEEIALKSERDKSRRYRARGIVDGYEFKLIIQKPITKQEEKYYRYIVSFELMEVGEEDSSESSIIKDNTNMNNDTKEVNISSTPTPSIEEDMIIKESDMEFHFIVSIKGDYLIMGFGEGNEKGISYKVEIDDKEYDRHEIKLDHFADTPHTLKIWAYNDQNELIASTFMEGIYFYSCHEGSLAKLEEYSAEDIRHLYILDEENKLKDISSLSKFHTLKTLHIVSKSLEDISPIGYCCELLELELELDKLSDVSPLTNLNVLESLTIDSDSLHDIEPLSKLTSITELNFTADVDHIYPINHLTNLTELEIHRDYGAIMDLELLSDLLNLKKLTLHVDTMDLEFLSEMKSLENLYLQNDIIECIDPISQLENLTSLSLNCRIDNLNAVSSLASLEKLSLFSCYNIQDLTPLTELKDLKSMTISSFMEECTIKLDAISQIESMESLFLWGVTTMDFDFAKDLPLLRSITIHSPMLFDIEAASTLTRLEYLSISSELLQDISPIKGLNNIKDLNLSLCSNLDSNWRDYVPEGCEVTPPKENN